MSAENVEMQEPLTVEELSTKVLKLELLLDQANKERARVEEEAKSERDVLYKQLNVVTVDHEERLKLKENPRIIWRFSRIGLVDLDMEKVLHLTHP